MVPFLNRERRNNEMTTRVAKGHIKVETADITITSALVL